MSIYKANFLWGNHEDSIEAMGYEFANAKTEEYQKECWNELLKRVKNCNIPDVVVPKGTLCDCINKSFLEDLCDDCDAQVNERWQP